MAFWITCLQKWGRKSFPQKPGLKPTISLLTDVFQTLSTYYILREINFGDYKHRKVPFLNVLSPSPNFRHQFFNVKVSTHRWHILGVLQMCPLTSLVKYFESTMSLAPSRELQSWKKVSFWRALDIFARYLELILEKILVGWFVLDSQKLNPGRN